VAKKTAKKAPKKAAQIETTIIDVVEEPVPGVFVVTEYESVRNVPSSSPGDGTDPDKQ
jgi:hypothetical protein